MYHLLKQLKHLQNFFVFYLNFGLNFVLFIHFFHILILIVLVFVIVPILANFEENCQIFSLFPLYNAIQNMDLFQFNLVIIPELYSWKDLLIDMPEINFHFKRIIQLNLGFDSYIFLLILFPFILNLYGTVFLYLKIQWASTCSIFPFVLCLRLRRRVLVCFELFGRAGILLISRVDFVL